MGNVHTAKGDMYLAGQPSTCVKLNKSPAIETIFLDCGASSHQEVEDAMGVHVNSSVITDDDLMVMNEKKIPGCGSCPR